MTVSVHHFVDVIIEASAGEIAAAMAGGAACILSLAGVLVGLARCFTHFWRNP